LGTFRGSMPAIVSKPYGGHSVQNAPAYQAYYQPQQVVLLPYGAPLMYSGMAYYQPVTYPQFHHAQPVQFVAPTYTPQYHNEPRRRNNVYTEEELNNQTPSELDAYPAYYSQDASISSQSSQADARSGNLTIHMEVPELNQNIRLQLEAGQHCRVSWLNRMLSKCNNAEEFNQAFDLYKMFQQKGLETTPETATLLIKAACRAEIPATALQLLKNTTDTSISPTLGGIHYLMINFSLKKDTQSVMEAYQITKHLQLAPTTRTFHILIRECVDNDLITEAMEFAQECKKMEIVPNRVTYNILMNGLRKYNKGAEILELRQQMNEHKIEINDTTVKFTVLAHMMLHQKADAVDEFLRYDQLDTDLEKFCSKFFEVTEESLEQKNMIVELFGLLKENKRITLPSSIQERLDDLTTSINTEINAAKAL